MKYFSHSLQTKTNSETVRTTHHRAEQEDTELYTNAVQNLYAHKTLLSQFLPLTRWLLLA